MSLPNFLIIGATKAGTTSLYYYLKQHPEIFMSPIKEPRFFINMSLPPDEAKSDIVSLADYEHLFDAVENETAIGEASVGYLANEFAAENIYRVLPEAKMIIVLRNPIDQVISAYKMRTRDGREPRNFDAVLDAALKAGIDKAPLFRHSFYSTHLKWYFNYFDLSQFQIHLYEDYQKDSLAFVKKIFDFLEVCTAFQPEMSTRYNESGYPRSRLVHKMMTRQNPIKDRVKQFIPQRYRRQIGRLMLRINSQSHPVYFTGEQKQKLLDLYGDNIVELQCLIDRDLSHWLELE